MPAESDVREGYRCCQSCHRVMPTILGFEEYGSRYRRVCRDCRAITETMRTWAEETDNHEDVPF